MNAIRTIAATGSTITIKPLTEADRASARLFVKALSKESIRQRLGGGSVNFSEEHLTLILQNSFGPDCVLGAFDSGDRLCGIARYARATEFCAEFAVIVSDDRKNQGIATKLLIEIESLARSFGYRVMSAQTLHTNLPMRRLANRMGYAAAMDPLDNMTLLLSKTLSEKTGRMFGSRQLQDD